MPEPNSNTPTNLKDQLRRDEDEVLKVYLDTEGIPTAGVGHNLKAHGIDLPVGTPITPEESAQWLDEDIERVQFNLHKYLPWVTELDEVRQAVLANMSFNLGIIGLLGFHRTLTMIEAGNYPGAAAAMLESKWSEQVGARAQRLSRQMETGEWV